MIEVEEVGDGRCVGGVLQWTLESEVCALVLCTVRVILDSGIERGVPTSRRVVLFEIRARSSTHRRPRTLMPVSLSHSVSPDTPSQYLVMSLITSTPSGENHVEHPTSERLNGLSNRVSGRGTGVPDSRTREPMKTNVIRDCRNGQSQLSATDAERSDNRLFGALTVNSVRNAGCRAFVCRPDITTDNSSRASPRTVSGQHRLRARLVCTEFIRTRQSHSPAPYPLDRHCGPEILSLFSRPV